MDNDYFSVSNVPHPAIYQTARGRGIPFGDCRAIADGRVVMPLPSDRLLTCWFMAQAAIASPISYV